MGILYSFILYAFVIVTATHCYQLNDFDLPTIFSKRICSNDILKEKMRPVCTCREKIPITDIHSLCRSYKEFGSCVESEIEKEGHGSDYLSLVFSNRRLKRVMLHLCSKTSDAAQIAACTKPEVAVQCNLVFMHEIKNSSSEKDACSLTEIISECYWRYFENDCSPKVRYFWYKLSEAYMANECSKYSNTSKGDKCSEIQNAFHPNPKKHSREECHAALHTVRQCFELDRLSSLHHDDIWLNMEFELQKFIRFESLRCEVKIEKDRNHHCEYPHRRKLEHCINGVYMGGFKSQIKELQQGRNVTVEQICRVYNATTECIQTTLKDCPVNALHLNALFCGSMPSSCHCPINIEAEMLARSSGTSRLSLATLPILLFIFISRTV